MHTLPQTPLRQPPKDQLSFWSPQLDLGGYPTVSHAKWSLNGEIFKLIPYRRVKAKPFFKIWRSQFNLLPLQAKEVLQPGAQWLAIFSTFVNTKRIHVSEGWFVSRLCECSG